MALLLAEFAKHYLFQCEQLVVMGLSLPTQYHPYPQHACMHTTSKFLFFNTSSKESKKVVDYKHGDVGEWFNPAVSKTAMPKGIVSSNLTISATIWENSLNDYSDQSVYGRGGGFEGRRQRKFFEFSNCRAGVEST